MIKKDTKQGESVPATVASAELEESGVVAFFEPELAAREKENMNSTMLGASFSKYSVDQLLLNSMHSANSAAAMLSLNKTSDQSASTVGNNLTTAGQESLPAMKEAESADDEEDYDCELDKSSKTVAAAATAAVAGKKGKRTRIKFRKEIIQKLEAIFAVNNFPDAKMREQIGLDLNIPTKNLQVWFKNKRAKFRKNQKEYYRNSSTKYALNCQGDQPSLLMFRPGQVYNLPIDNNNNNNLNMNNVMSMDNFKLGCDNGGLFTSDQQQALFNYGNYLFSNTFNNVSNLTNNNNGGEMNVGQLMERMMCGRQNDFGVAPKNIDSKAGYQLFQNVLDDSNKASAVMNYFYSLPSPDYFNNQHIVNTINAYDVAAPPKNNDEPSFVQFDPRALFSLPDNNEFHVDSSDVNNADAFNGNPLNGNPLN